VISYLAAGTASFFYIALKAVQQRQVMSGQLWRMPPLSIGMALCEVFVISNVARTADSTLGLLFLALCIGIGGGAGSVLGTWWHIRRHG
jgi:hypothetical protein